MTAERTVRTAYQRVSGPCGFRLQIVRAILTAAPLVMVARGHVVSTSRRPARAERCANALFGNALGWPARHCSVSLPRCRDQWRARPPSSISVIRSAQI